MAGQVIPGTVRLAYYDKGGMDKAYHSYEDHNFGSCDLNPCDGWVLGEKLVSYHRLAYI